MNNKKYNVLVLPYDNIDTDIIIPKQFLKQTNKNGLGKYAFYEWRYHNDGTIKKEQIADFSQNKYNVLITKHNFGCGSSREHAAWALNDFGFEIIVASSYSDIFYRNWLNNHQLPIVLPKKDIETILKDTTFKVELDLKDLIITINEIDYPIKLSKKMHTRLLNNIDEIDYTMTYLNKIKEFDD